MQRPRTPRECTCGERRARSLAPRPHPAARSLLLALALLAAALLAATAQAAAAPAGPAPAPHASSLVHAPRIAAQRIGMDALARITGGTCTTCSSGGSGGGGGGTGSSGSPTESGAPYWSTYRVTLDSTSTTPASLVNQINNYSDQTINGTFEYTRTVVRDVQFSGGYADFVKASVGGEVSSSIRTSVTYPIAPRTYGKLYVKYRTERRTYYGRQYQDFNDGTRTVVDSDYGPYLSTTTVLG
ncbi:MAG: hypothetical protein P8Y13_10665, partial [Deinococcales bacterium]